MWGGGEEGDLGVSSGSICKGGYPIKFKKKMKDNYRRSGTGHPIREFLRSWPPASTCIFSPLEPGKALDSKDDHYIDYIVHRVSSFLG